MALTPEDNPFASPKMEESVAPQAEPETGNETQANPFEMNQGEKAAMSGTGFEPSQPEVNAESTIGTEESQPQPNFDGGVTMNNQSFQAPDPNAANNPNAGTGFGQPNMGGGQPAGGDNAFNPAGGFNPGGEQPAQGGNMFGDPSGGNPPAGGNQPAQGGFTDPNAGGGQPAGNPFGDPSGGQPAQGGGNFNPGGNQPAQGGGGFSPPGGGNQQGNKPQYNIIDMLWLLNKKLEAQQALGQGEASILTVGFNSSFNNLRLSFHGVQQDTFTQSSVIISNAPRLAMCNLHSETALQIMANKGNGQAIRVFERVIKAGNWTPNMSAVTWNQDNITIQTQVQNQDGSTVNHFFTLVGEQVFGFEKCLEFLLNGQSWLASLICK